MTATYTIRAATPAGGYCIGTESPAAGWRCVAHPADERGVEAARIRLIASRPLVALTFIDETGLAI